jgi:hypothetical protein
VRPQDGDLIISMDRGDWCEYPIDDQHVVSKVNVRINAPYVTLEQCAQCRDLEQFRITTVFTRRLQDVLDWSNELSIFPCIEIFIFHEFYDRPN